MVYMASDTTEIKAIAPGFDHWLSYREALLKIAREGVDRKGQAMSFIEQKLKGDVLPLGDTLLLCQNLRSTWSWLNNGQIATETIDCGFLATPSRHSATGAYSPHQGLSLRSPVL